MCILRVNTPVDPFPRRKIPKLRSPLVENMAKYRALYLMAIPGMLFYILFKYVPMFGLVIAFEDYNIYQGMWGSPFVGLKHFLVFFQYPEFVRVFKNSLIISFYDLVIAFPVPILLALLLNEIQRLRFKRIIQTVVYMPHFLSWVIVGGIIIGMLSPGTGIINYIIKAFGHEPIYFMINEKYIRPILIGSGIWKDSGWGTIIFLAAIVSIDPSQYEAAIIDGARRFQRIWHITLPGIMNTFVVMLLLKIGYFLDFGFERVYIFLNSFNKSASDIFDTYIYAAGLQGAQYSYTTAIGIFKSVIGLILLLVANTVSKKLTEKSIF